MRRGGRRPRAACRSCSAATCSSISRRTAFARVVERFARRDAHARLSVRRRLGIAACAATALRARRDRRRVRLREAVMRSLDESATCLNSSACWSSTTRPTSARSSRRCCRAARSSRSSAPRATAPKRWKWSSELRARRRHVRPEHAGAWTASPSCARRWRGVRSPIVIISIAAGAGEQVLAALDAGAIDFVQKPTALATEKLMDIADELVEKVKAAARAPRAGVGRRARWQRPPDRAVRRAPAAHGRHRRDRHLDRRARRA